MIYQFDRPCRQPGTAGRATACTTVVRPSAVCVADSGSTEPLTGGVVSNPARLGRGAWQVQSAAAPTTTDAGPSPDSGQAQPAGLPEGRQAARRLFGGWEFDRERGRPDHGQQGHGPQHRVTCRYQPGRWPKRAMATKLSVPQMVPARTTPGCPSTCAVWSGRSADPRGVQGLDQGRGYQAVPEGFSVGWIRNLPMVDTRQLTRCPPFGCNRPGPIVGPPGFRWPVRFPRRCGCARTVRWAGRKSCRPRPDQCGPTP